MRTQMNHRIMVPVSSSRNLFGDVLHIAGFGALLVFCVSPLAAQRIATPAEPEVIARVLLTGDTMPARYIGEQIAVREDPEYPFQHIRDYLLGFDVVTTNLESPVSTRGTDQGQLYPFRAHPRVLERLGAAHIGIVHLANNHIFDYGEVAAIDTLKHLAEANIDVIGAGRTAETAQAPVFRRWPEVTVAFLGFTNLYGAYQPDEATSFYLAPLDLETMTAAVRAVRESADIVIVQLHWGWEYETAARKWQRDTALQLLDAGADIVAGHHPHVIQEFEETERGFVAYSLGNFVFDQNFSPETSRGLVLEIDIYNDATFRVRPREVAFAPGYQPYPVD